MKTLDNVHGRRMMNLVYLTHSPISSSSRRTVLALAAAAAVAAFRFEFEILDEAAEAFDFFFDDVDEEAALLRVLRVLEDVLSL